MILADLQLGDVVHTCYQGQATVVGLDPSARTLQVLIGWNRNELTLRNGKDSHGITVASYATNLHSFENTLWVDIQAITGKVGSTPTSAAVRELPCRQCGKPNDTHVSKCWWCETTSLTTK